MMRVNPDQVPPFGVSLDDETLLSALKIVSIGCAALICGYAVLATLSTLVQETWLHGVSYRRSTLNVLLLAGLFTPLCGIPSGIVVGLIGRRAPLAHGFAMCALIVAETAFLFATHRVDGPLWFEASAGASVGAGVMVGACIVRRRLKNRRPRRIP